MRQLARNEQNTLHRENFYTAKDRGDNKNLSGCIGIHDTESRLLRLNRNRYLGGNCGQFEKMVRKQKPFTSRSERLEASVDMRRRLDKHKAYASLAECGFGFADKCVGLVALGCRTAGHVRLAAAFAACDWG